MADEKNNKKNYEIVKGNITELNISQVDEHITPAKPRKKCQSNNIVIPQEKNKK